MYLLLKVFVSLYRVVRRKVDDQKVIFYSKMSINYNQRQMFTFDKFDPILMCIHFAKLFGLFSSERGHLLDP